MSLYGRTVRCPIAQATGPVLDDVRGCRHEFVVLEAEQDLDSGMVDCPKCGVFFDPDHPNNQPQPEQA